MYKPRHLGTYVCLSFVIQVLCSALVIREDVDIGSVVVGDIHRKSTCAELQVADAIEVLARLRNTQLDILYSGLGLKDPTDDIVDDIAVSRTLLGEFAKPTQLDAVHTPKGFVAEVQDALSFEGLEDVPPQSGNTPDQPPSQKDVQCTPVKTVSSPAPLSPDGFLCTMHSKSPCAPTELHKGKGGGPWFQRTPALTLLEGPPADSVTRRLELGTTPIVGGNNSLSSSERGIVKDIACVNDTTASTTTRGDHLSATPTVSILSEVRVAHRQKPASTKPRSKPVDNTLDDNISKTSQKSDGR